MTLCQSPIMEYLNSAQPASDPYLPAYISAKHGTVIIVEVIGMDKRCMSGSERRYGKR